MIKLQYNLSCWFWSEIEVFYTITCNSTWYLRGKVTIKKHDTASWSFFWVGYEYFLLRYNCEARLQSGNTIQSVDICFWVSALNGIYYIWIYLLRYNCEARLQSGNTIQSVDICFWVSALNGIYYIWIYSLRYNCEASLQSEDIIYTNHLNLVFSNLLLDRIDMKIFIIEA